MSVTIDCGEGKHDLCVGWAKQTYLFPQYDGERFECDCPCHKREPPVLVGDTPPPGETGQVGGDRVAREGGKA